MVRNNISHISETIFYSKDDLIAWKNKTLLYEWRQQFPELIQDHFFNLLFKRSRLNTYCFGELFTGIYYANKGYKFLYEPWIENFLLYEAKKADLKKLQNKFIDIFVQKAGLQVYKFIQNEITHTISRGQPDLFVYNENEYFFVEVKRVGDKVSREQKIFINMLNQSRFKLPIKLMSLLQSP